MNLIQDVDNVVSENFDGEYILIHMHTGIYYSLQNSAALLWEVLGKGCDLAQAALVLQQAYGIAAEQADIDLRTFFDALSKEQLIIQQGGEAPPAFAIEPQTGEYLPPALNTYDDLKNLLLIDPIHDVDPDAGWPNLKPES